MTEQGNHPRHGLADVIHAPVRLSIVAALAGVEKADFRFLRDTIEVSDSLLSKHLTTLEAAGYVQIVKSGIGRRVRTWVSLTPTGQTAFAAYKESLEKIINTRD
ncbi:winged helix-turn-helix domain-containing protein [Micromonospora sediminicola]|uniref:winged helix-turn-helix domain-containing protein n=1 Tax=Micromonospora sediminicola TaxID=946078 RepID=UPI00378867C9